MAIFHLTAKVISRGKGQSAIAAAAYRSGERLRDEQANQQKYYTSRAERIQFTDIMAPADAPEWAHDRNALWNHAERAEKRKDAQLAREIEVSLPHELTAQQREWLVKDFAREAFVRKGYAVDIAIHAPDGTSDGRNHHAHLMVTRRTLGPEGFSANKDWQFDKKQLGQWREQWAHLANRHLERHGHSERIDHRSLKDQGIDREATVHLGYAAHGMAQRGAQSDRMDELREILARNEIRLDVKALERELRELEKAEAAALREEAQGQRQMSAPAAQQQQQPDAVPRAVAAEAARPDPAQAERVAEAQRRQEALREREAAAQAQAQRRAAEQAGKVAPAVPIEVINARHAAAEAEARRVAEARTAREAAERAAFKQGWERGYPGIDAVPPGGAVKPGQGMEAKAEPPAKGIVPPPPVLSKSDLTKPVDKGLRVLDRATGVATKLTDFVTDLLAGAPAAGPRVDTEKFTMDPAERKQQQLARLAARQESEADAKALERIEEDIKKGVALKPEDIRSLTRQHQESIRQFGDEAVRQMVDDARKYSDRYWKGSERERE
jgi:hypothetical protein